LIAEVGSFGMVQWRQYSKIYFG